MTEEIHPIVGLTDEALQALLRRAIRNTLILGLVPAVVLSIAYELAQCGHAGRLAR